jgi:hypothetical protein
MMDPSTPGLNFTYFYLPHHNKENILHTVSFVPRIFAFFEEFLGHKYETITGSNMFKMVFVDVRLNNSILTL